MATANGTPTIPSSGVQSEIGTVVDRDRIWGEFLDGRVFTPYDVSARRLDEMLRVDGKARAIEQALTLPLRGATPTLEPSKGDRGEADFIRDALWRNSNAGGMSTPFELVISQAVSACLFRRAFFEKVLKVDPDSGRVVYDKVSFRPAATCRLKLDPKTGNFAGFRQRVPDTHPGHDEEGYVHISPQRAFVFIYGQHRRPVEGVSDVEAVFALFEAKQKVRYLWMTFLENQTMPKAVAQDDSNDPNSIANFAKTVAGLKGGGVVGIGQGQSVTPFETSNAAAQTFQDAVRFLDSEMFASVLAGFLELATSAASGKGSFALSESQTDFFLQSRQAVLTELAAAIENFLIADLIRYNFGRRAAVPRFTFGSLKAGDVENSVTLLQALATTQQTVVPVKFIQLLAEKVAGYLDLDVAQVSEAIAAGTEGAADPTQQFVQAIGAATQIVQQRGLTPVAA